MEVHTFRYTYTYNVGQHRIVLLWSNARLGDTGVVVLLPAKLIVCVVSSPLDGMELWKRMWKNEKHQCLKTEKGSNAMRVWVKVILFSMISNFNVIYDRDTWFFIFFFLKIKFYWNLEKDNRICMQCVYGFAGR